MTDRFDLVVIGGGPAGERGAAQAAYFGKRVAVIERESYPGGAGTNTGTVPSKTLRETALYFSGLNQHALYGVDSQVKNELTVKDLMYREQEVVRSLRQVITENIARHAIEYLHGHASFADPHTIRVLAPGQPERLLQAEVILIATGSVPFQPSSIPFEDPDIDDSDTILQIDRMPQTLLVMGAGVIGCEYASVFAAMGVKVTLVEPRDELLSFLDADMSESLRLALILSLIHI